MSNNLDLVRGLYAAFAAGDIPAVLGVMAPDIHWTEAEGGPYGGVSIGPEAVLQDVFMKLGGEWDGYAAVPAEFVDGGDTVVVLGEYSGTYKATGKGFRAPFAHVWKFRDGKAVSFHQHTDTAVHLRPLQA
jgi:ketosteroid isomerase-like protein